MAKKRKHIGDSDYTRLSELQTMPDLLKYVNDNSFLNSKDLASIFNVNVRTIYQYEQDGLIPQHAKSCMRHMSGVFPLLVGNDDGSHKFKNTGSLIEGNSAVKLHNSKKLWSVKDIRRFVKELIYKNTVK